MMMTEFRERVEAAWSEESSYCPEDWGKTDPSWGQCAVTAVLLQKEFGGELYRGWAINVSKGMHTRHYWNRLNGIDIDLTWRQFPVGTKLEEPEWTFAREIIANKWMEERFKILKSAFYRT